MPLCHPKWIAHIAAALFGGVDKSRARRTRERLERIPPEGGLCADAFSSPRWCTVVKILLAP